MKKLKMLSWRARGAGGTCMAEVGKPVRGYQAKAGRRSNPFSDPPSDGAVPTVTWISFDEGVYWVRLSTSAGWPRTIRVTQADVDGASVKGSA